jgi:hypothetical protein
MAWNLDSQHQATWYHNTMSQTSRNDKVYTAFFYFRKAQGLELQLRHSDVYMHKQNYQELL